MIARTKALINIEFGYGRRVKIPADAEIEGAIDTDGFFAFKWRNVGNARLPLSCFSEIVDEVADQRKPDNAYRNRGKFPQGHAYSRGERHGQHKLSRVQVNEIRRELRGGKKMSALAIKYRVSKGTIAAIKYRKTWKTI